MGNVVGRATKRGGAATWSTWWAGNGTPWCGNVVGAKHSRATIPVITIPWCANASPLRHCGMDHVAGAMALGVKRIADARRHCGVDGVAPHARANLVFAHNEIIDMALPRGGLGAGYPLGVPEKSNSSLVIQPDRIVP
jgi:hypothetical protein